MNNLQKHFLPYELSKELKELGFDMECLTWWGKYPPYDKPYELINDKSGGKLDGFINHPDTNTTAPLISQALEFLREKYKLAVIPSPFGYEILDNRPDSTMNGGYPWGCIVDEVCENYEQAQEAGILNAIELIKQNKQ